MAGQAQPDDNKELTTKSTDKLPTPRTVRRKHVRELAARLYGRGYSRSQIARLMAPQICPWSREGPRKMALAAQRRLRTWEQEESFRDLIYKQAVVELDMDSPAILKGIAGKAKRGRVDAARLALELTGRHSPKGDAAPAQVAVVIQGVPRPVGVQAVGAIESSVVEVEEEDED